MAGLKELGPRLLSVGLTVTETGGTVGGLVYLYGNRFSQFRDLCTQSQAFQRLKTFLLGTTPQSHEHSVPLSEVLQALREQFDCATALTPDEINTAAGIGALLGLILVADRVLPQNRINEALAETGDFLTKLHPVLGWAVPAIEFISTVSLAALPFMIMEYAKIVEHLPLIKGNESTWEQILMRYTAIPVILAAGRLLPAVVNVAQSGVVPMVRKASTGAQNIWEEYRSGHIQEAKARVFGSNKSGEIKADYASLRRYVSLRNRMRREGRKATEEVLHGDK